MGDWLAMALKCTLLGLMMVATGFFHYLLGTTLANKAFNRRTMLWHSLIVAVEMTLAKLDNILMENGIGAAYALVAIAVLSYFLYGARGRAWLSLSFRMLMCIFCMELVSSLMIYALAGLLAIPPETMFILTMDDLFTLWKMALITGITNITTMIVLGGVLLIRRIVSSVKNRITIKSSRQLGLYVRLFSVAIIGTTMFAFAGALLKRVIQSGLFMDMYFSYMVVLVSAFLFMLICLSYFVQDVRYLQQLRRNETLEQQQAINHSLLTSLRSFRHNTVNMLYGFEGAILSRDTQVIDAYYQEMTEKCALVNNENIVALERVTNPIVSALLLRAVERARQESLPINLYVQEGLRFSRALPDSDLCEVLGVLLDNAIEAAAQADVRYVSVELRNVDNAMEAIIKNTYAGLVTEAQLLNTQHSSKPGHSGHGLRSVRELLSRRSKAFLNLQIGLQYVSAQLLIQF